jgi:hypothetical protein
VGSRLERSTRDIGDHDADKQVIDERQHHFLTHRGNASRNHGQKAGRPLFESLDDFGLLDLFQGFQVGKVVQARRKVPERFEGCVFVRQAFVL